MYRKYTNKIYHHKDFCELAIIDKENKELANTVFSKNQIEKVKKYKWQVWPKNNKWGKVYYYIATKINNKTLYLHHIIKGKPEWPNVVDHINQCTFDNRDENLRFATRRENVLNSEKTRRPKT
jgi:hypothetical protein